MEITLKVVLAILAIYEVVARAIPTVNQWGVLQTVINLLKKLSDVLNNKKDY